MNSVKKVLSSYWKTFRVIFVIFSLYLLKDVLYRWNGVSYYASLADFLPGVALITVLWSSVALILSTLIWLPLRIVHLFSKDFKSSALAAHSKIFISLIFLSGIGALYAKPYVLGTSPTIYQKLALPISIIIIAGFFTWALRSKNERIIEWINIQERITPLVWIFGTVTIVSMIVTIHIALDENPGSKKEQTSQRPTGELTKREAYDTADPRRKDGRPNIILVTYDALTARNMSIYGYQRKTTPFIDKWAETATVFKKIEAESNHTSTTTGTLMSGQKAWSHKRYQQVRGAKLIQNDAGSLPLLLKKDGYFNMAFVVNPIADVDALGISASFDIAPKPSDFSVTTYFFGHIHNYLYDIFHDKIILYDWILLEDFILYKFAPHLFKHMTETSFPPEKAFKSFFDYYDNNIPKPFFVWIHLFPPHDFYLPPPPYMGMFNPTEKHRTVKEYLRFDKHITDFLGKFRHRRTLEHFPTRLKPEIEILKDRYDEFIRYCDKTFADFIKGLEERDLTDNSVIILSSDHGESFKLRYMEHGRGHLYEQVTHIPLIIKEPDQKAGRSVDALVEQVDIPYTILDLANIDIPPNSEGRSLKPFLRGSRTEHRPAYAMDFMSNPARSKITAGTIAVWDGNYKLIHYLSENVSLLYNLADDYEEVNNLFLTEPDVASKLMNLIQEKMKMVNEQFKN